MQKPEKAAARQNGRPRRDDWKREQTRVWAKAVLVFLEKKGQAPSSLGEDGRADLWSRYQRGLTSPTEERVSRIEQKVPGTARYFHAAAWALSSNQEYCSSDLKTCLTLMSPAVAEHFSPLKCEPGIALGAFWRKPWLNAHAPLRGEFLQDVPDELYEEEVDIFVQSIDHAELGLDMLGAYLFLIREAQLRQEGRTYLRCLSMLPEVRRRAQRHLMLVSIGSAYWLHLIEPLSRHQFADPDLERLWRSRLSHFPGATPGSPLLQTFRGIWAGWDGTESTFIREVETYLTLAQED